MTTVRVEGLLELQRAFTKIGHEVAPEIRKGLLEAAQPVADSAREKISRFSGASLGTIQPKVLARGVYVYQNARKVTGLRGDYGALQMRVGLVPALDENTDAIVEKCELVLDRLGYEAGF